MIDDETLTLLRASLREVLTGDADVGDSLRGLGWDDVMSDDPAAATICLFETQGEALASTGQLDAVCAAAAGLSPGTRFAWPHPGTGAGEPSSVLTGSSVDVSGIVLPGAGEGGSLAVPTDGGIVLVDGTQMARDVVNGIDPDAGWCTVHGSVAVSGVAEAGWEGVLAAARRALASELVGASAAMLGLATAHVTSREQFGRPIGSYQSVRHRLAEAHAHIEGARAVIAASWEDGAPGAAGAAKAVAGQAHADVARHCLQVCGAMGLTWEFDLHRFVRRGYAVDALLGSARQLARAHGTAFLEGAAPARVGSPAGVL